MAWEQEQRALDEKWGTDRDQPAQTHIITKGMLRAVEEFTKTTVYPELIAAQKERIKPSDPNYTIYRDSWEMGYPYAGAIGGGDTWIFTSTSIGDIVNYEYRTSNKVFKLSLLDHCNL